MITNFKIFEQSEFKFKKGDYVIAVDLDIKDLLLKNYLENTVGQIVSIEDTSSSTIVYYETYYENVPKEVKSNFWMDDIYNYETDEIRLATPEEIALKKYNI